MLTRRKAIVPPENCRTIELTKGKIAIVDPEDFEWLNSYYWRAVLSNACWYAVTRIRKNGKLQHIKMHRMIMKTPAGMEPHHRNLNSLDNRRDNLENLIPPEHKAYHGGPRKQSQILLDKSALPE